MSKLVIYHGSKDIIEKPYYHGGKAENDYGFGFYCTENLDLAKEWSCSNNENNGFANKYSIDTTGLKILDLTNKRYSILNWVAILLKHRTFDLSNEISKQAKEYLIKNFYIDVDEYDIVRFTRAVYGRELERCRYCYESRMEVVAKTAKEKGFDAFTTTLLVSPYQKHDMLKEVCIEMSKKYDINFLYVDFRPGFREGQQIARDMGLYMQKYWVSIKTLITQDNYIVYI